MISKLVEMSNKYGKDSAMVLAGGGNTSWKNNELMFIKGSGTQLATIQADGFVGMQRSKINAIFEKQYPAADMEREAAVLKDMMNARLLGNGGKRPSVEAALHHLMKYSYVLHLHPALVNGLTCGKTGKETADRLFGDSYTWIPVCKPGYTLSMKCREALGSFKTKFQYDCRLIILQNHGIFFAADTLEEMDTLVMDTVSTITKEIKTAYDFSDIPYDSKRMISAKNEMQRILNKNEREIAFLINRDIHNVTMEQNGFAPLAKPFTPDHIVYCRPSVLWSEGKNIEQDIQVFIKLNGYAPKIIAIKQLGIFAVGDSEKDLKNVCDLFLDAMKIAAFSKNFGGYLPMPDELVHFIAHWEIESYRSKMVQ